MTRDVTEPAEAAETLRDLRTIGGRSQRAASTALTQIPLATWGLAWAVRYALLALAPSPLAVPVGCVLAFGAALVTWIFRSREVTSGRERRTRAGWLALLLCSPFLIAVVSPIPVHPEALFLGALWGVALLLFAIATLDLPLGVVGALIVLAAAGSRIAALDRPLLVFGLIAGWPCSRSASATATWAPIWRSWSTPSTPAPPPAGMASGG